ncbi:RNA-binding domain-containing protein [Myriangium duriaei CBS 260.36]|uniref:RNA-binding domain-containing protein n=1 Tax=Myriangium duriaei CBS 260.36 TaxID=1168546 RepID=A0A9P4IZJ2_9PEZI|nr:RNA-binding domain-containing protein [Myriangium duriaei CBS 260.36]
MHHIRRAALRGLRSQPVAITNSARSSPFSSRFVQCQNKVQISWNQARLYSDAAEKANASPAEEEGGQTVTREPSAEEQKEIKEESIATSNSEAVDSQQSTTEAIQEKVSDAANTVASTVRSATDTFRSERRDSGRGFERRGGSDRSFDRRGATDRGLHRGSERVRGFQPPAEPSKILYIGNLYFDLTPDRLSREFSQFGTITNVKIVTDASGMSKGFGYVEFDNLESAGKAIEELNGQDLEGRPMAVQYHRRRGPRESTGRPAQKNPPSRTLFIGNLSFQMSDKDLHDLFTKVKNVMDVRVAIDRRSGQPRGFAHADFTDQESAETAKKFLENKVVYGRQLRIDYGLPSSTTRPRDQ